MSQLKARIERLARSIDLEPTKPCILETASGPMVIEDLDALLADIAKSDKRLVQVPT